MDIDSKTSSMNRPWVVGRWARLQLFLRPTSRTTSQNSQPDWHAKITSFCVGMNRQVLGWKLCMLQDVVSPGPGGWLISRVGAGRSLINRNHGLLDSPSKFSSCSVICEPAKPRPSMLSGRDVPASTLPAVAGGAIAGNSAEGLGWDSAAVPLPGDSAGSCRGSAARLPGRVD